MTNSDVRFEADYPNEDAFAEALYYAFFRRYGMYYPNGKVTVEADQIKHFVKKFNRASEIRQLLQSENLIDLTEAFCFGVFLASGTSVAQSKVYEISSEIFNSTIPILIFFALCIKFRKVRKSSTDI